jgi:hypothetical protein
MVEGPTPAGGPDAAAPPPDLARTDGRPVHPSVRYEPTDVNFLGFLLVLVVAAAVLFFVFTIVWRFYKELNNYESQIRRSRFPLAPAPAMRLPPEPRLEELDRAEGVERPNVYRREEAKEEALRAVGPADEPGFVRVPVERAMKAVAGKLPAEPGARQRAAKSRGLVDGGEPNSGRLFREGPP